MSFYVYMIIFHFIANLYDIERHKIENPAHGSVADAFLELQAPNGCGNAGSCNVAGRGVRGVVVEGVCCCAIPTSRAYCVLPASRYRGR